MVEATVMVIFHPWHLFVPSGGDVGGFLFRGGADRPRCFHRAEKIGEVTGIFTGIFHQQKGGTTRKLRKNMDTDRGGSSHGSFLWGPVHLGDFNGIFVGLASRPLITGVN